MCTELRKQLQITIGIQYQYDPNKSYTPHAFGRQDFSQNCPYEPIILQDILEISKGEQGLVSQKICYKNTKISQCSNVIFLPSNNIILFEKISSSRQSAYYHAEIENILDEIINIQTISEHSWPKMCECNFFPTSDF